MVTPWVYKYVTLLMQEIALMGPKRFFKKNKF